MFRESDFYKKMDLGDSKSEGGNLLRKYYEEYLEFKDYLEFRLIHNKEILKNGRKMMSSHYVSSYEEVFKFLEKYSSSDYNIYVSSNTRKRKGRKDADVDFRRTFYFDVEKADLKPSYADRGYYTKLIRTVFYLKERLEEKGLSISMVKESGRGIHVGVKIEPLDRERWDKKFKYWFKNLCKEMEKDRPHKDIKFSDSVFNISRIESAPGSRHTKYEEEPKRRILFLDTKEQDLVPILEKVEIRKPKSLKGKRKKKVDEDTILETPEYKLLAGYDDLPEGKLHNNIILQLKILVRDNNIDTGYMEEKLAELDYNEVFDTPPEEYQYNPNVLVNWCMENYEYCLKKGIYPSIEEYKKGFRVKDVSPSWERDERNFLVGYPKNFTLHDYRDVFSYIRDFNGKNGRLMERGPRNMLKTYVKQLKQKIRENCKDEKLYEYMEKSGVLDKVLGIAPGFVRRE